MWQSLQTDKEVAAAILGATVAGAFALIALVAGWFFEVRRWGRERTARDAEWRRDQQSRDDDRRREQESRNAEWVRDKALDAYSGAVYYLFKLSLSAKQESTESKDVRQHISESRRHLLLIRAHTPNLSSDVDVLFTNLDAAVGSGSATSLSDVAGNLGHKVVALMMSDARLHVSFVSASLSSCRSGR